MFRTDWIAYLFATKSHFLKEDGKILQGKVSTDALYLFYIFSHILTAQRTEISASALVEFVEHLQEEASIAIEKTEKAEEHHILAQLGDFGQHLVYRRASATWEDPRWVVGK